MSACIETRARRQSVIVISRCAERTDQTAAQGFCDRRRILLPGMHVRHKGQIGEHNRQQRAPEPVSCYVKLSEHACALRIRPVLYTHRHDAVNYSSQGARRSSRRSRLLLETVERALSPHYDGC